MESVPVSVTVEEQDDTWHAFGYLAAQQYTLLNPEESGVWAMVSMAYDFGMWQGKGLAGYAFQAGWREYMLERRNKS